MLTAIPLLGVTFALMTGAAAAAGIRRILQMGSTFPSGSYRLVIGGHPTVPAIIEELAKEQHFASLAPSRQVTPEAAAAHPRS
jgi:hypothetical protein